jgi:hypothetical protein
METLVTGFLLQLGPSAYYSPRIGPCTAQYCKILVRNAWSSIPVHTKVLGFSTIRLVGYLKHTHLLSYTLLPRVLSDPYVSTAHIAVSWDVCGCGNHLRRTTKMPAFSCIVWLMPTAPGLSRAMTRARAGLAHRHDVKAKTEAKLYWPRKKYTVHCTGCVVVMRLLMQRTIELRHLMPMFESIRFRKGDTHT